MQGCSQRSHTLSLLLLADACSSRLMGSDAARTLSSCRARMQRRLQIRRSSHPTAVAHHLRAARGGRAGPSAQEGAELSHHQELCLRASSRATSARPHCPPQRDPRPRPPGGPTPSASILTHTCCCPPALGSDEQSRGSLTVAC